MTPSRNPNPHAQVLRMTCRMQGQTPSNYYHYHYYYYHLRLIEVMEVILTN